MNSKERDKRMLERDRTIEDCMEEIEKLLKIRSTGEYGCALFEALDALQTLKEISQQTASRCMRHQIELDEKHECASCVLEDSFRNVFAAAQQDFWMGRNIGWNYEDYQIAAWREFLRLHPSLGDKQ